jgi:hypothetical protein
MTHGWGRRQPAGLLQRTRCGQRSHARRGRKGAICTDALALALICLHLWIHHPVCAHALDGVQRPAILPHRQQTRTTVYELQPRLTAAELDVSCLDAAPAVPVSLISRLVDAPPVPVTLVHRRGTRIVQLRRDLAHRLSRRRLTHQFGCCCFCLAHRNRRRRCIHIR